MPGPGIKHGFAQSDWDAAKEEARSIMIERAKVGGMIPYSELARRIESIKIETHDKRFFDLLGEISSEENAAGRGMLTVLVVHKFGDGKPGPGFFKLAEELGRNTSDILECWIKELQRVHAFWSDK